MMAKPVDIERLASSHSTLSEARRELTLRGIVIYPRARMSWKIANRCSNY